MHVELIEVMVCYNEMEAQIAKGLLEENGIETFLRRDDCGGMEPQLQITEGIKVLVYSDYYRKALAILKEVRSAEENQLEGALPNWICASCGEESEAQFTDCWNCGASREIKDNQ